MGISDRARDLFTGKVGFRIDETMAGTHRFEPGMGPEGDLPFRFDVRWGPEELGPWLRPGGPGFMVQPMSGTVTAGGLCDSAPIEGTLELKYISEGSIRYSFDLEAEGKTYEYVGEKVNIRPWNLPVSHTTCFGVLKEKKSGRLVSRSVTFFRMKTLPAFLASFRLVWHPRDVGSRSAHAS